MTGEPDRPAALQTLRVAVGDSPLAAHHRLVVRALLNRGDAPAERQPGEVLAGDWSPQAVALARANWRRRMVHEHQSSAVFSGLLPQLIEAEAPLEYKTAALRYAMDELRHATLCGEIVEHLGGTAEVEADLTVQPLPPHLDCPPRERALRNVLFTSLCETVSVALLSEERDRTTEPFVGRVLRQLSGDEVGHARLGWLYLAHSLPRLDAAGRERLVAYLSVALGHLEAEMLRAMPPGDLPQPLVQEAQQLGFTASSTARSLLYDTLREVIIPQLEAAGLPAQQAWQARRRPPPASS